MFGWKDLNMEKYSKVFESNADVHTYALMQGKNLVPITLNFQEAFSKQIVFIFVLSGTKDDSCDIFCGLGFTCAERSLERGHFVGPHFPPVHSSGHDSIFRRQCD